MQSTFPFDEKNRLDHSKTARKNINIFSSILLPKKEALIELPKCINTISYQCLCECTN